MKQQRRPFAQLALFIGASALAAGGSALSSVDLSVEQFNAPGKAWRVNEARADYLGAAQLLEAYLAKHGPKLAEEDSTLMHFHALQMYAAAGRIERALTHAAAAKFIVEPADWPLRWNAYVDATVAFLQHDRSKFERAREVILAGPKPDGEPPNLRVVDRLRNRFDEPYSAAYGFPAPNRQNQSLDPTARSVTPPASASSDLRRDGGVGDCAAGSRGSP